MPLGGIRVGGSKRGALSGARGGRLQTERGIGRSCDLCREHCFSLTLRWSLICSRCLLSMMLKIAQACARPGHAFAGEGKRMTSCRASCADLEFYWTDVGRSEQPSPGMPLPAAGSSSQGTAQGSCCQFPRLAQCGAGLTAGRAAMELLGMAKCRCRFLDCKPPLPAQLNPFRLDQQPVPYM